LAHFAEHLTVYSFTVRRSRLGGETHRNLAAFKSSVTSLNWTQTRMHTNAAPSERRMPSKGNSSATVKMRTFFPSSASIAGSRGKRSCLGKIHLTRERLHFVIIQAAGVSENGERITVSGRLVKTSS